MVASIPNDIFQFSTYAALTAGFNHGQPRTADLASHGSDGIGVYENGNLMVLKDGQAFEVNKDCVASRAQMHTSLPFAMVTMYHPTHRMTLPSTTLQALEKLLSTSEQLGSIGMKSANTLMPFSLTGYFDSVDLEGRKQVATDGSIFGFVVPTWLKSISGPRLHGHYLDKAGKVGGRVVDFETGGDATLSFAKCGRFHLGFPQGEEWEEMQVQAH